MMVTEQEPEDESLASVLLALPEVDARRRFLEEHRDEVSARVVADLEDQANRLRLEKPAQALRAADAMLHVADSLDDERARASGLRVKGNLLLYQGRCRESISLYREAREIRARHGEELEIARLQVGWTWALKDLARYEEALELGLATRDVLIEHEKWDWVANLELNVGSIYRLTDRYDEARAVYEQCREHFLRAGNPVGAAQAQVNMARALVCQDQFREALTLLEQARSIFETHEAQVPLARTDLNLATLFFWLGRYREAWERYDQAREAFERQGNEMEVALVDLYSSRVHLRLNLFPEALELAQSARPVFDRLGMARYVALADFSLAMAYRGLGEGEKALDQFRGARAFFAAPQGAAHRGDTLTALIDLERAALLREIGRPAEALSVIEEAMAVFSQHGLSVRQAQAQLLIAECHSDKGQTDQALPLYQSVVAMPREQRPPTLAYRARYGLGQAAEASGRPEAALDHYRAAVEEIEAIRRSLRVDEFKASFLDDKLTLYQDAVRLSLEMGHLEEAFGHVERAKSSALLDLLARDLELRAESGEAVDSRAWERLRALKEEWLWHHSKLEGPTVQDPTDAWRGEGDEGQAWRELQRVEAQIRRVLRRLQGKRGYLLVEARDGEDERSWQAAVDHLGPDTLLIEYFCVEGEILAFLASADGLEVCRAFPYSLREIERSLGALNLALRGLGDLDPEYVQEVLNPLARRHLIWLHEALIAPLGKAINGHRKLVIAPHDALYYLPFHALHDGERYLIERFAVQYAPSAGVLARCYQAQERVEGNDRARPALVMGYSDGGRLCHVLDEVEAVAAALEHESTGFTDFVFQEDEATLAQLRRYAGRCRLVHLASHAVFRSDNPLFSSIKLADEPLNVIDVYHLRLNASLVTLSGCETGRSQLKGGGLFGLARGCLHAGAPALVASLWQVDDASTTALMKTFYRRLEAGNSIAAALRAAQLALLQTEHDHPHYWAPFFLMGADNGE
jgi:tetratricopeptide (TPR) repeat protein